MGNQSLVSQMLTLGFPDPFSQGLELEEELPFCLEEGKICSVQLHPHLGDGERAWQTPAMESGE